MFEKRKRWTGWTLALAMMLSLAPQGTMAAEITPPAVQEAAGASSSAAGETVGKIEFLLDGEVKKSVELVAGAEVSKKNYFAFLCFFLSRCTYFFFHGIKC